MALSGLQIFKQLPKTNCKECGKPTCMAFAMALAGKKCSLSDCPYASDELTASLEEASAPPMGLVKFGQGDAACEIGQETVMFRHEEKFHRPTVVTIRVSDALAPADLEARLAQIKALDFERVGRQIGVGAVAVVGNSGDAGKFAAAAEQAAALGNRALVLCTRDPALQEAALAKVASSKPLLHAATAENAEAMASLAKANACPLAVTAADLDGLAELVEKVKGLGVQDLVLSFAHWSLSAVLRGLTRSRTLALKKNFRALGHPTLAFATGSTPHAQVAAACALAAKYAGVLVIDLADSWASLPLLTTAMDLYTDPQKPAQVQPGLHEVGAPGNDSPVFLTTNFSLTYYTVEADVEASRMASYIVAVDTEGTSVMTAYSGDKLNEKTATEAISSSGVAEKVGHKKIIIPGHVSVMSGALQEESGWSVLVGPKESSGIARYMKTSWAEAS